MQTHRLQARPCHKGKKREGILKVILIQEVERLITFAVESPRENLELSLSYDRSARSGASLYRKALRDKTTHEGTKKGGKIDVPSFYGDFSTDSRVISSLAQVQHDVVEMRWNILFYLNEPFCVCCCCRLFGMFREREKNAKFAYYCHSSDHFIDHHNKIERAM